MSMVPQANSKNRRRLKWTKRVYHKLCGSPVLYRICLYGQVRADVREIGQDIMQLQKSGNRRGCSVYRPCTLMRMYPPKDERVQFHGISEREEYANAKT